MMEIHSVITVGDQLTYFGETLDDVTNKLGSELDDNENYHINQLVKISTSIKSLAQDISQKEEERKNLRALHLLRSMKYFNLPWILLSALLVLNALFL
jgi:hypothetical protein